MIYVKMMGGLGNQLFQYATWFSLSKQYGFDYCLDVSHYDTNHDHGGFRLDRLALGDLPVCRKNTRSTFAKYISKLVSKYPLVGRFIFREYIHEAGFDRGDLKFLNDRKSYALGYWQSAEYFSRCHCALRKLIKPNHISNSAFELSKKITIDLQPLSIHIRRGDYVDNKSASSTHGVCSVSYYKNAVSKILSIAPVDTVYVFSDDIEWVKAQLYDVLSLFKNVTFVSGNTQEEDLWLMSQAKHHIIANSSFSWWGAWLAKHDQQMVIAPTPWYDKPPKYSVDPSLPEWIRLPK
jgi:hypothetical protein